MVIKLGMELLGFIKQAVLADGRSKMLEWGQLYIRHSQDKNSSLIKNSIPEILLLILLQNSFAYKSLSFELFDEIFGIQIYTYYRLLTSFLIFFE